MSLIKHLVFSFSKIYITILLLAVASGFSHAQMPGGAIDSLKKELDKNIAEEKFVTTCFLIADNFMEADQYDSAQTWLNKIAERLTLKQPSISNYFLSTRQAEVYYYNGLQRLGLQEAQRSLSIAQALNDSLLLADSYNFLGLFYINLDSFKIATYNLQKGIEFAHQPPYSEAYLGLSRPHHLYGNLAEAYEKRNKYDSAIYYSRRSLELATGINSQRGVAIAQNNLATLFLKINKPDSSLHHYKKSLEWATEDFDVELINYGGLAKTEDVLQNKEGALNWLKKGFMLIEQKAFVNSLFTGMFLDNAIFVYWKYSEHLLLAKALNNKNELLQKQISDNNRQINVILNAGLQNETRLLNLQVKEAEQRNEIANTRVYLLISLLVLLAAGFVFYRNKAFQKLRVVQLQNKISQDLHDDVGSSLSSLQVYSAVADTLIDSQPDKAKEMLGKISRESASVMENIGDIVWSMKTEKEQSLEHRIKNFVSDVLGAANINYHVLVEEGVEESIRLMEARRNILLIIKEAVNNTVKYSKASQVAISIKKLAGHLCVQVTDNGMGFDKMANKKRGDGLSNMERRTVELGGIYEITSSGKGTTISALLPLTKISDSF